MNPDLAQDAELERLCRERVELEERQERAHEEVVALRRQICQNEVEAAEERAEADRHIKAVQKRLRAAEHEAQEAAKELKVDVSVDLNEILQDDSGIDELLFGEINFPQLLSDFDHEDSPTISIPIFSTSFKYCYQCCFSIGKCCFLCRF